MVSISDLFTSVFPEKYDYNLIVIGAGSAGLVSSYLAAGLQARVLLIEREKMGGDCLNTGCVPSKALIRSAKFFSELQHAESLGFSRIDVEVNFAQVMERVQRIVKEVEPHDSVERYESLGVECATGDARVISPHEVEIDHRVVSARRIIVATGGAPIVPDIPGMELGRVLTSETVWQLRKKPQRLLVVGGGPIGCELAQAFSRLGCNVTLVVHGDRLLKREDVEVSQAILDTFVAQGITVLFNHDLREIIPAGVGRKLVCETSSAVVELEFDEMLLAVGRRPVVAGFGLEELGVEVGRGGLLADGTLRTSVPSIYCAGDVVGPYLFTHMAAHQAGSATFNALFDRFWRMKVDYRLVPWATFVDPEVARVGLNEQDAKKSGVAYEVTRFDYGELDRSIADSRTRGWIKIITPKGKDKILGVTIVGSHAGDSLAEYVLAMKHGLGLKKILATIHIYPTVAEGNKMAAGVWQRDHLPVKVLPWLKRFHRWSRGGTK